MPSVVFPVPNQSPLKRRKLCQTCTKSSPAGSFSNYLMRSPGRVFTRTQILEHVWGYDFDPSINVVDVCIQRIRKKIASIGIGADGESPIESVRGVGYRFRKRA